MHDVDDNEITGLDTTIDWKNTEENSYDGEKLKFLAHDESAKWVKPNNILNNWRVTKTCLRLGSKIIGKCMMGSTSNALSKGGENYKNFMRTLGLQQEMPTDKLSQDFTHYLFQWNGTWRGLLIFMVCLCLENHLIK